MHNQILDKNWFLSIKNHKVAAVVPGSVYKDLMKNGILPDPYWRDNEQAFLEMTDGDFAYQCRFEVLPGLLAEEKICLRFHGLDSQTEIRLNGKALGNTVNMHRSYEFHVKGLIRAGSNTLVIRFTSPLKLIGKEKGETPVLGAAEALKGFHKVRKAHAMYGWDWGPRLPDGGIWKPVELVGFTGARLEAVQVLQEHGDKHVTLHIAVETEKSSACSLAYEVIVTDPHGGTEQYENSPESIKIEKPMLWWPRGCGKQHLYTVKVILFTDGKPADSWEKRIGLRQMELERSPDAYGESFAHKINGLSIFAMGANYIPEDAIYSRMDRAKTRLLLEDCCLANFNLIRVWGGGFYPHDYFYELCDELGLLVWQDLMLGCTTYDYTEVFKENVLAEIRENVARIRHHACLALWCGNTGMELLVSGASGPEQYRYRAEYLSFHEHEIKRLVENTDPGTPFWASSPSSGGMLDDPNGDARGDVHYWPVWKQLLPVSEYRNHYFRYASEFGIQALPQLKTIESFTEPADRHLFSYIMERHNRFQSGNQRLLHYCTELFGIPQRFGDIIYVSQLAQAEALWYAVSHMRCIRGICMGAVYWQLNDCWPVISWSSIDCFGRWKAAHYYAKKLFAPLLLTCKETGLYSENTSVNSDLSGVKKALAFCLANETGEERHVKIRWTLRDSGSRILREEEIHVTVHKYSSLLLDEIEVPEVDLFQNYVSYALYENYRCVSDGTVMFARPKHFQYQNPELSYALTKDKITVCARAYAKGVALFNENEDLVLSDNYFDMDKGEKTVTVLRGDVNKLRIRSLYDTL